MGLYGEQILPRLIDWGMQAKSFAQERPKCVARATGRVLELGFGSGLNLPHYTNEVTELLALEPARLGRRLARERVESAPFPVEYVGLDGADIPLDARSVDCVTCTWTLCTIPDVTKALSEVRRVLKPDGLFHFLEHGASPEPRVRKWQDRLNPIQKFYAGGCNLNREMESIVRRAGFEGEIETFYMNGPKFASFMSLGSVRCAEK